MAWGHFEFPAIRQSDRERLSSLLKSFVDCKIEVSHVNASMDFGPALTVSGDAAVDCRQIFDVVSEVSTSVRNLTVTGRYGVGTIQVTCSRLAQEVRDNVSVQLSGMNQVAEDQATVAMVARFGAELRTRLLALDSRDGLSAVMGAETKRFFEHRESELVKIEEFGRSMLRQFSHEIVTTRAQLEKEYLERRAALDAELARERAQLLASVSAREQSLELQAKEIEQRAESLDDRDARHVRREIRREQKKELEASAVKFALTQGTRDLRKPSHYVILGLAGFLFLGAAFFTVANIWALFGGAQLSPTEWIVRGVEQTVLTAGFISVMAFYARWNNAWHEQHAAEEFRLKRLGLDLDRASWLVETAMEWKEEKGVEAPAFLIDRLSAGLFSSEPKKDEPQRAVDKLVAAILDASAEVTVPLPGGATARIDRKSMGALEKKSEGR